jgi:gamma-glutamyltranspeptidase / glutathione hydrolase
LIVRPQRTLRALAWCLTLSALPGAAMAMRAGAVASPDRYGAMAAREILQAGGNAVDAAVATGFALAVTYPEAGNLGGGGFMTLVVQGKPYFLDYRERAPAAASAAMFLDAHGELTDQGLVGNLASAVPGTVRGLYEAHRRFARLSWQRDLAPALRYARRGFRVTGQLVAMRDQNQAPLLPATNFSRYFGAMRAGQLFRQPALAATLTRIARNGVSEFYQGRTAQLLVAQMQRGSTKGIISAADLAGYHAMWREPVVGPWHGFTLVTAPPPSSGGIALLQMLQMKDDAARLFDGVTLNSPQYLHLLAEIEKRVFADRAEYLGDPDFIRVPVAALLDADYLRARAAQIDPERPSPTPAVRPGLERPQTTHYSIIDAAGNAVSNTYTLNGWFGSGVVVEGAGFLLNDEMDDFSAKPGVPNQYGVVGADANAIAPFKRPLSSMSPSILLHGSEVAMVLGTPGGSRIFTSVFQVLVDVYDFHLTLADALRQPRYHHQLLPENTLYAEPYAPFADSVKQALIQRGYRIDEQDYNGDIEAIQVVDGQPTAAADPRARGVAMVVKQE